MVMAIAGLRGLDLFDFFGYFKLSTEPPPMPRETFPYDSAEHLDSDEAIVGITVT